MNNYIYSCNGYEKGALGIIMYGWKKYFLPGNKVTIRFHPQQVKILHVSYSWDEKKKIFPKVIFNHCIFRARVPKKPGNKPILYIEAKIQFIDGKTTTVKDTFDINSIYE